MTERLLNTKECDWEIFSYQGMWLRYMYAIYEDISEWYVVGKGMWMSDMLYTNLTKEYG